MDGNYRSIFFSAMHFCYVVFFYCRSITLIQFLLSFFFKHYFGKHIRYLKYFWHLFLCLSGCIGCVQFRCREL